MASPTLLIDALYANPSARVYIQHPEEDPTQLTVALTESDFPLSVQAVYSDSDEAATQLGVLNKIQQGLSNFTGGSQRVLKVVQQTFSQYNGSSKPQFTLPITLVKYREDINIMDQISDLYAGVYPTFEGPTIRAPYGYGLTGDSLYDVGTQLVGARSLADVQTALANGAKGVAGAFDRLQYDAFRSAIKGTWAIQYSTWFRASKLVLIDVNGVISKENARGTNSPLYAKLNLVFQPAILPSQQEVRSWFIRGEGGDAQIDAAQIALQNAQVDTRF